MGRRVCVQIGQLGATEWCAVGGCEADNDSDAEEMSHFPLFVTLPPPPPAPVPNPPQCGANFLGGVGFGCEWGTGTHRRGERKSKKNQEET